MAMTRRAALRYVGAMLALPTSARFAHSQNYPTRAVHWIVPFPAGGPSDILARLIGQALSARLGQPFVIENRVGASGNIGTQAVVVAPPDGHTLLFAAAPNVINAALYSNLGFDFARDIAPVASIARGALVMLVAPSFPATTVCGVHCPRKGQSGQTQHGVRRQGHPAPCCGRALQNHGRG
jgi:tripartite-type tricarboxylate transporter receptor subunit TctC